MDNVEKKIWFPFYEQFLLILSDSKVSRTSQGKKKAHVYKCFSLHQQMIFYADGEKDKK